MYFQKYTKYKDKNKKIGGSLFSTVSKIAKNVDVKKLAQTAKKVVKKGSETVILAANKASEKLNKAKKEIEKKAKLLLKQSEKNYMIN